MKKILFVTHYPGIGGANLSMLHLIINLRDYENITPLVFLPKSGPIEDELRKEGICYEIYPYLSWRIDDRGWVRHILRLVLMLIVNTLLSLALSFRYRDIDVLYANSSKVILPAFLKIFLRKPLVWHLREFGTNDYPMAFLLPTKCVEIVFQYADALIAISHSIENYYKELCPKGNFFLIYNGIEDRNDENKVFIRNRFHKRICIVGGCSSSKNQEDLINAISLLKARSLMREYKLEIDIIGDNHTDYGLFLQKLCKEKQLDTDIVFCGEIPNANLSLSEYDIGVITSKAEAFGRVIIEYMMARLVVIGSDAGACPELIKNGETGFLYELGNASQLADVIEMLLTSEDVAIKIADAGYKYAKSNFTARINAHNVKKVIDAIC